MREEKIREMFSHFEKKFCYFRGVVTQNKNMRKYFVNFMTFL